MIIDYQAADFLHLGLCMAGFDDVTVTNTCYKTNLERFKSFFYASPQVCERIFEDLQTHGIVNKPMPKFLLLALNYLKEYKTKHGLAAFVKLTEKTALNRSKDMSIILTN